MKARGRRLGRVMRWGVYVCTIALLFLTSYSFIEPAQLAHQGAFRGQPEKGIKYAMRIEHGRMYLFRVTNRREYVEERIDSGGDEELEVLEAVAFIENLAWWELPSYSYEEPWVSWLIVNVPLVYPTAMLSLLSLVLLSRLIRAQCLPGHCPSCGYLLDGLASSVCPECGVAHG